MLLLSAAVAGLLAGQPAISTVPKGEELPATKSIPDVTYTKAGGVELKLDLVLPTTPGPHPTVVCFHGGAWAMGDRKNLTRPALFNPGGRDGDKDLSILDKLAQRGYVAVSVGYRLAPKHKFPAQIEDAKTAVRFLRTNAKQYGLDPERFAAMGFSAGGHIALLLGLTGPAAGLEGTDHPDASSKVQCVVDFFGPTDMSLYADTDGLVGAFMVPFLGKECRTDPNCYKRASPVEYVSKDAPPTLMIHGTVDVVVPIIHSERLLKKLKDAGAEAELKTVPWKGHGWEGEAVKTSAQASLDFLNKHLMKPEKK